jgi:beta-N-acetylhexosaminidase
MKAFNRPIQRAGSRGYAWETFSFGYYILTLLLCQRDLLMKLTGPWTSGQRHRRDAPEPAQEQNNVETPHQVMLPAQEQSAAPAIIPEQGRVGMSAEQQTADDPNHSSSPEPADPVRTPQQQAGMTRGKAILLMMALFILLWQGINNGMAQFIGPQGWAYVLGSSGNSNSNLLRDAAQQTSLAAKRAAAGQHVHITPEAYIDRIIARMTLEQKLGQMMIVQFLGASYSLPISTMISQYNVGAVLLYTTNGNIVNKAQLKGLIQQMKSYSAIPLAVAIDQEGGVVNRLASLDGPRPSEAQIGATNNPLRAKAAGIQDAQDLASYGFNLNLAPVVDVNRVYNPQLYTRTYGDNPAIVTSMAGAYLQGLQQSGKVLGALKHFPGLGDVSIDPHVGVPDLRASRSDLEQIDWAPYRALIKQGLVHAVLVTHELVAAVDPTQPSTLSSKLVTGILRDELGFQGVIITDSLTMEGITAYYPEDQAAALAVEAGCDLLMGASSPEDVAAMISGIQQAMSEGKISQQRIDDSVHRILMMKYEMGLLPLPKAGISPGA